MEKRRIGIFAFYEKNGIVEDYVIYLLHSLKECLDRLVVVCNGYLSEAGRKKLEEIVDDICIRENQGYDIGAFQECMLSYIGKNEIKKFDELVLCNDTFFGPFVPFSMIFSEMEKREIDFWGLSAQPKTIDFWTETDRVVPAFIQSFFIVIGTRMIKDECFWKYWAQMDVNEWNITQIVTKHEQYFTPYFETLGYSWDVYTDNSFFEDEPEKNRFTPYLVIPYELIKYGNCPFLKKKCIVGKDISQGMEADNGSLAKAMEYIRENIEYVYDLILKYMLAHCTKKMIADKLKLSYVVSSTKRNEKYDYSRIGIVIAIKKTKLREQIEEQFKKMDRNIFTYIVKNVDTLNMNIVEEMLPPNIEYICVLQESFSELEEKAACTEISSYRYMYENLIKDNQYILSVIHLFERDNFLGVLAMPDIRFGILLSNTVDEIERGSYWIRRQALRDMSNYYIGTVYQKRYAELELINKKIILQSILQLEDIENRITDFTSYFHNKVFAFCRKQKRLYLYGAGGVGVRTAKALDEEGISFDGFIVSDGQRKYKDILGHKVYSISEIDEMEDDNIGIVVAVEERLHNVIEDTLKKHNIRNYFYSFF